MQIVTLTMNPTIDSTTKVERVTAGPKLRCETPRHEPGGGGINVSRAIKKLGGESLAIFTNGGPNGDLLDTMLDEEGIKQASIPIDGLTRENLTIFEENSDEQYRFVMPGPKMSEAECIQCLEKIRRLDPKPEFIVASGSLPGSVPEDFYAQVASLGKELGARVIVDTTGEPLRRAVDKGVFMIKPNMRELKQVTNSDIENESQMKEITEEIVGKGQSDLVVVSLGAGGAFMASKNSSKHLRAPTVPIKSKVGAGDSMVAGIVLSLAKERSLEQSVQFGIAAGAAAVMTAGTELCRGEDAERLYQQVNPE